jgi:nucleoside-diphosphate-sugar epimerase
MKIFVTGASGFVGSEVVKDLLNNGYEVLGLSRSDNSAKKIRELGADVHFGDITDIASLQAATEKVDGIIHTAFNHDFTRFQESCKEDRQAILAMGEVFKGSNKPLVITAAAGAVATGKLVNEKDKGINPNIPRIISEITANELADQEVNVSIVRLPPSVHGVGDTHGFIPTLVKLAMKNGKFAYIGDGMNAWAAVHKLDAATVFRLVMEKNKVPGTIYHAVAESQILLKDLATLLSEKMNLPFVSLTTQEAATYFEGFIHFAQLNIPISSDQTQKELGWKPVNPTLSDDIESKIYF